MSICPVAVTTRMKCMMIIVTMMMVVVHPKFVSASSQF